MSSIVVFLKQILNDTLLQYVIKMDTWRLHYFFPIHLAPRGLYKIEINDIKNLHVNWPHFGQVCGFPGPVANCSQHGTTEYVALTCTGDLQKKNIIMRKVNVTYVVRTYVLNSNLHYQVLTILIFQTGIYRHLWFIIMILHRKL